MNTEDKHYFNLLIRAISSTFLIHNSAPKTIKDWKGENIATFQEDLFNKVKATISEKWFYTYIKNDPEKLPRIDMFNLLSNYSGFKNWESFKTSNKKVDINIKKSKIPKGYVWLFLMVIIIAIIAYLINIKNTFQFCFIDEDKNETIHTQLDIKILQELESPIYLKTDSSGCFTYQTKEKLVRFVVQSPYYKTDTITRTIESGNNTTIKLHTDDYALMLHYYSNGNTKDWGKRKEQLYNLIENNAQIYQVFTNNIGVELYSKEEFINKLTTPTSSLQKIKILDKSTKNGKIIKLKFMIK